MFRKPRIRRSGAIAVETAVVSLVMFLLLFALIIGGVGVFRYELVALQAREAARWTSVRGSNWASETNQASPKKSDILRKSVLPYATTMEPDRIRLDVYWIDGSTGKAYDWDSAPKHPISLDANGRPIANRVRVVVSYDWEPLLFGVGVRRLQSASEVPMSF